MTYGFIGLGNMASAILRGMAKAGVFAENALVGYNPSAAKAQALQNEMPLRACSSAREAAEAADVVVLAVKPQVLPDVLPQIASVVTAQTLVVSIAAGKPTAYYEAALSDGVPVVRVMPNIAARVGASASAVCGGKSAQEAHLELVRTMFRTVGAVYDLPEKHFPAFGALGGASGAFVFLYIDALASAGVKGGLPRALAQQIAEQTVLGSAQLSQQSAEHPIALMDQVCSPGGTTIEGVHTLKRLGFETAVQQAIDAIIEKDKRLAQ